MTAKPGTSLQGCRILVVEDEVLIAMELESVLQAEGCIVVGPAPTCEEALSLIEQQDVDACLLDLNLKGSPTTPVADALSSRQIPFVLVSAYTQMQSPEPQFEEAPRVGKPFEDKELLATLAGVLAPG